MSVVRQMTPAELQQQAIIRLEMRDLQRQNTRLQAIVAELAAQQQAMLEWIATQGKTSPTLRTGKKRG